MSIVMNPRYQTLLALRARLFDLRDKELKLKPDVYRDHLWQQVDEGIVEQVANEVNMTVSQAVTRALDSTSETYSDPEQTREQVETARKDLQNLIMDVSAVFANQEYDGQKLWKPNDKTDIYTMAAKNKMGQVFNALEDLDASLSMFVEKKNLALSALVQEARGEGGRRAVTKTKVDRITRKNNKTMTRYNQEWVSGGTTIDHKHDISYFLKRTFYNLVVDGVLDANALHVDDELLEGDNWVPLPREPYIVGLTHSFDVMLDSKLFRDALAVGVKGAYDATDAAMREYCEESADLNLVLERMYDHIPREVEASVRAMRDADVSGLIGEVADWCVEFGVVLVTYGVVVTDDKFTPQACER